MDRTVRKWHAAIISDCEQFLGRRLALAEREFITSREGFIALEMIHDYVRALEGDPAKLETYLNSETAKD